MKTTLFLSTALATCALFVNVRAAENVSANPADPYANETPAQRDARLKWWREARFGMFIHWGVYSVPAGTYLGKRIGGIGEWIMCDGKIPMATYQAYAKKYNPAKYNPDAWVKLARDAGMKYIVITAKHHDGFANFDSRASDWNIVKATPYGKDVLKPLAQACRKYGLKLGFYYSQAQDWNNGGSACSGKWDPAQDHSMDDYINKVAVPQVRELLSNYGEFPAVLWWDTPCDMNKERADKLVALLRLKPGIIHNNRLGIYPGDTETPEQFIPPTGFGDRDWETCMTMNDTWGFKSYDDNWKSTETLLRNLVDIASKGGNYLLNVGPTAEGVIPQPSVDRLRETGQWLKRNGQAVYGTTQSPWKKHPFDGRCTVKGNTLYVSVFNWPDGPVSLPGLKGEVLGVAPLDPDAGEVKHELAEADGARVLRIQRPARPDPVATVVVVRFKEAPAVDPLAAAPPVRQADDVSVALKAADATIHGDTAQYESGGGKDNIGFWTRAEDWVSWNVKVTRPGTFTVEITYASEPGSAGSEYAVTVGDGQVTGKTASTGSWTEFKTETLGTLKIPAAGAVSVAVKPKTKPGVGVMNLKAIALKMSKE